MRSPAVEPAGEVGGEFAGGGLAEAFEVVGGVGEFGGEFAEFGGGGAVVECGDDVFGGAAELVEAVLEVGEFCRGEDDCVFG